MTAEIVTGDCVAGMAEMAENSVDAVVCDPPYGLEFMGKEWDRLTLLDEQTETLRSAQGDRQGSGRDGQARQDLHYQMLCAAQRERRNMQAWHHRWAVEALRVLKPGGHLLAFGGARTAHRLVCALEDAGFEIRDTICWLYGQGFPKSLDVGKAIDKAAGAEREVVHERIGPVPGNHGGSGHYGHGTDRSITAPATADGARWQGWGTALKPAHEPICVARKPLDSRSSLGTGRSGRMTVAENVLRWGTGGINVDGCRVPGMAETPFGKRRSPTNSYSGGWAAQNAGQGMADDWQSSSPGRWPANVCLDAEAAEMLDAQSGELAGRGNVGATKHSGGMFFWGTGQSDQPRWHERAGGGASRFFYCAKARPDERETGLIGHVPCLKCGGLDTRTHVDEGGRVVPCRRNGHPTVKPVSLMRWLVRLVTPPGGTVLDPFAGSGTTGVACAFEGFRFIGFEQDAGYAEIARQRIAWAEAEVARVPERLQEGKSVPVADGRTQGSLFGEAR